MGALQVADVRTQVSLSLDTDFTQGRTLSPAAHREKALTAMLDQLVTWAAAMKTLREQPSQQPLARAG